jgi:hypothetical protein
MVSFGLVLRLARMLGREALQSALCNELAGEGVYCARSLYEATCHQQREKVFGGKVRKPGRENKTGRRGHNCRPPTSGLPLCRTESPLRTLSSLAWLDASEHEVPVRTASVRSWVDPAVGLPCPCRTPSPPGGAMLVLRLPLSLILLSADHCVPMGLVIPPLSCSHRLHTTTTTTNLY